MAPEPKVAFLLAGQCDQFIGFTMTDFHLLQFSSPDAFLEAVWGHDEGFMNFPIGVLLDSMNETQIKARKLEATHRILLAVYDGDAILYVINTISISAQFPSADTSFMLPSATLTKPVEDFPWILSMPRDLPRDLDETDVVAVVSLFVAHLPTIIDPKLFNRIVGAEKLVHPFINKWAVEMADRGLQLEVLPTLLRTKVSYTTLATIPPPSPALLRYQLEIPTTEDLESLTCLFLDFRSKGPDNLTLEVARNKMRTAIALGEIWVCRVDGDIAGFCATGRVTPRTMAIRHVYVSPKHRQKGIAEAMVKMMTRYFLGAKPLGFSGGLADAGPPKEVKEEMALNVAEDFVERLYRKCGFLLGEDDRDPANGRKGWFYSSYMGVKLLEN